MFGRLSISRVIQSSTNQGTKLTVGFITRGNVGGLVTGKVLSDVVASMVLAFQVFRDDKHVLKQGLNWEGIKKAARRYRNFPLFDSWSTLLNTVSRNLPPFLLVYFFGPAVVGFFALGYRMISLPMGVLGHAVAQVYFQKASEAKREGNLAQVTKTAFRWLVILGLFPVFALMIVGPELFSVIFGQEWRDAGVYASILSPWLFFSFVSSPLSTIFSVLEKQQELTALLLGGMTGNPFWAMAFMGGSGAVIYLWLCLWNLKNVGVHYIDSINILSRYFFMSIPAIVLLICVKYIQFNAYLVIAIFPDKFLGRVLFMSNHEESYYEQDSFWDPANIRESDYKRVSDIMASIPSDVNSILDVGCGGGVFVNGAKAVIKSIVAVDRSRSALNYIER